MGTAIGLVLFSVLCASVGGVQGVCNHVQNDDLVEYSCVGGQLSDLNELPPSTGKIRIYNMPIQRITPDTFSMFGSDLWVLSCSHCGIIDIEPGSFHHLDNLQHLSLDNNRLTTVRESWFRGLDSLTYLDLNYNNIETIEDGVFGNLPNLVDMRLSGNRLECINLAALGQLRELKRMFLSENSEFKCPNAITTFLENRGIGFEKDPQWSQQPTDLIHVEIPPVDYDYYDGESTGESTTSLPPYRERLHPTPTPASTATYIPPKLSTTEEVVYRPIYNTQDWRTSTRPTTTIRYDDSTYDYTRRPYYVPPTIAPIDATQSPATTEHGSQDATTWRSWPKFEETTAVWPEYPPHRNEDKHHTEQPDYFTPPDSLAPGPGDRKTSSSYVELEGQTADYGTDWSGRNPSDVRYPPNRGPQSEDGTREPSVDATSVTHSIRPLPPMIVHPPSPDNVFQPPYYEHPVTMHAPPSMVNQPQQEEVTPNIIETTTDKPLPNCPTQKSSSIRSSWITIVVSIFLVVARHVFVEGF